MAGPRRALISSVVGGSRGAGGAAVSAAACCSRARRCLSTTSMRWSASAKRAISSGEGGSSRWASSAILSSNSDRTLSTARRVVCPSVRGPCLSAHSAAWSPTSRCMSTRPRMLAVRRSSMEPDLSPPPCRMLAAIASTAEPSSISSAPASRPTHCVLSRSMPRSCRALHTLCTAPWSGAWSASVFKESRCKAWSGDASGSNTGGPACTAFINSACAGTVDIDERRMSGLLLSPAAEHSPRGPHQRAGRIRWSEFRCASAPIR